MNDPVNRADPLGLAAQIGWLYHIEGEINGQRVVYDGSTVTPLKERFSRHQWKALITDPRTRIQRSPVFAEPNVETSGRRTMRSALNEAVRGPEQLQIDRTRAQIEEANRNRAPAEPESRILNKQRAAKDPALFNARHNTSVGEAEEMLQEPTRVSSRPRLGGAVAGLFLGQALLDAYLQSIDVKEANLTRAPYVMRDAQGEFTLGQQGGWFSSSFSKTYVSGEAMGKTTPLSRGEFVRLKKEAEATWGTTDWKNDFVPGVMQPVLPVSCPNCA